jgi:hypothetical protein
MTRNWGAPSGASLFSIPKFSLPTASVVYAPPRASRTESPGGHLDGLLQACRRFFLRPENSSVLLQSGTTEALPVNLGPPVRENSRGLRPLSPSPVFLHRVQNPSFPPPVFPPPRSVSGAARRVCFRRVRFRKPQRDSLALTPLRRRRYAAPCFSIASRCDSLWCLAGESLAVVSILALAARMLYAVKPDSKLSAWHTRPTRVCGSAALPRSTWQGEGRALPVASPPCAAERHVRTLPAFTLSRIEVHR